MNWTTFAEKAQVHVLMHASNIQIQAIAPELTYELRHQVLWPDRPITYVILEEDFEGLHYGAIQNDQVMGVISVFQDGEKYRFRKFAVHPDHQGKGVGSALLRHVIKEMNGRSVPQLWCDARVTAIPFYERFGMKPGGAIFYKGEIAYTRFVLDLNTHVL
ncbi:GNAT family N-acetyltransferase [Siphonobacter sp. SORGH_AS_0500]|uniref:GNAT family N-acetyltransferase n=1 Tax=Siphonobacter sp. SORGH_AS_0500 TaxID=1864824 RepID=UPI002862CA82|nr:GNAT family N-acetyltransferase [Siphonobacter sp. SORGH_AS_0500]MDR6197220.1 GNAT superfamily N-acetyltransferase [Siphonobacter sp. SORGH_AS_0500]